MGKCERCGRPTTYAGSPLYDATDACPRPDGPTCRATRAAYIRGLREGFAVAAERVDWKRVDGPGSTATWAIEVDWTATIDEIERRAK
jgi:hypothetical protein